MKLTPLNGGEFETAHSAEIDLVVAKYLAAASGGDVTALFDLGVAFSTGSNGVTCNLIEAHKWFNIAASRGHEEAAGCRAAIWRDGVVGQGAAGPANLTSDFEGGMANLRSAITAAATYRTK